MAGIPIVGASGASGASGAVGAGITGGIAWRGGAPEAEPTGQTTASLTFGVPRVVDGAGPINYTVQRKPQFGPWANATAGTPVTSGTTVTVAISGLSQRTTYTFRVVASSDIFGVTKSITSVASNSIKTASLTSPGTTGTGPGYIQPETAYEVRGYTDSDNQDRKTTAGGWGVVGDAVSDLSNRTEDNIRSALNWQMQNAGSWFNASDMVCGMMSEAPFLGGLIDGFGDAGSILGNLINGFQGFIDIVLEIITCGVYDGTPGFITDAIDGLIDFLTNGPIVGPLIRGLVAFADWLGRATGNFLRDVFIGIASIFDWIMGVLCCREDVVGTVPMDIINAVQSFIDKVNEHPIVQAFTAWAMGVGDAVGNVFLDSLSGAASLFELLCSLATTGQRPEGWVEWTPDNNPFETIVSDIVNVFEALCGSTILGGFVDYVVEPAGRVLIDGMNGAVKFLQDFAELLGLDELLNPANIIAFVKNIIDCTWGAIMGVGDAVGKTIAEVIQLASDAFGNFMGLFADGTPLGDVVDMVGNLLALLGENLMNTVDGIVEFFQNVIDWLWNGLSWLVGGAVDQAGKTLQDLVEVITDGISQLPLIGPIVKAITGQDISTVGTDKSLLELGIETLENFFAGIALGGSSIVDGIVTAIRQILGIREGEPLTQWIGRLLNPQNIVDALSGAFATVLATLPISHVNNDKVNLLNLGDFITGSTLNAADGWSWDSSRNRSGLAGGSAKVTCNGTERQLYSNQNIRVTPGDRLAASASIYTSGFSGGSTSIVLSLIPFAGAVQKPTVNLASRGASNNAWVELTNESSPYEVPVAANPADQITSIQMRLAVTSSATAGTVNFDDIWLWKTGLMQQNLVDSLVIAFQGIVSGLLGLGTVNTGYSWQQLFSASGAARTRAETGVTNAGLASAAAATAQSTANQAISGASGAQATANSALAGASGAQAAANSINTRLYGTSNPATNAKVQQSAVLNLESELLARQQATNNLKTSIVSGYNVQPVTTNGYLWTVPSDLSELYVACFGGGAKGQGGFTANPVGIQGQGGLPGEYTAAEIDVKSLTAGSQVLCTIGNGNSTDPSTTSFGNILTTLDAFKKFVVTPLGLIPTRSTPGGGGLGAIQFNREPTAGENSSGNGVLGGSPGTQNASTQLVRNGSPGGNGLNFGLAQTGGSGGGGGAEYLHPTGRGGDGGAGGFPGGGGGGGGHGGTPGSGGPGGAGMILIIWKIAKVTA